MNKFDEALKSFNKAIELHNFDCDIYMNKGRCLLRMNRFDEAMVIFQEVYNFASKNDSYYLQFDAINLIGNILMQQYKYEESLIWFDKISIFFSIHNERKMYINKAMVCALLNHIDNAADFFFQIMQIYGGHSDFYLFSAYLNNNNGKKLEMDDINKFEDQKDKDILNLNLSIYQDSLKFQKIYQCYEKAKTKVDSSYW